MTACEPCDLGKSTASTIYKSCEAWEVVDATMATWCGKAAVELALLEVLEIEPVLSTAGCEASSAADKEAVVFGDAASLACDSMAHDVHDWVAADYTIPDACVGETSRAVGA